MLVGYLQNRFSLPVLQRRALSITPCSSLSATSRQYSACSSTAEPQGTKRYAIIGGGFAGAATAHYLAATASVVCPVTIHLYDIAGLGSGGSGAAGGLLHPFSPKGKLLWQGQQAFETALELIGLAEAGAQQLSQRTGTTAEQFVWRQDILRPAADAKQTAGFEALQPHPVGKSASVQAVSSKQAHALLPGLNTDALPNLSAGASHASVAALLIKGGLVLHPYKYLRAVWQQCEAQLAELGNGSEACLRLQQVHALTQLEEQHGPYDAVVVAAGAAAATLPEVGGILPLRLCQGYGLELTPKLNPRDGPPVTEKRSLMSVTTSQHQSPNIHANSQHVASDQQAVGSDRTVDESNDTMADTADHADSFPTGAPSLVGATYMGVQGGQQISVGATKQFGITPEQALQECGRRVTQSGEIAQAETLLRPKAEALWSPASTWQVARVRTGVRALPQNTVDGAVPLAGQLPSTPKDKQWWIVGGLGARGLVYHAWLGKLVAQAVIQGSDACLPTQLRRWKVSKSARPS
ncbi:hypothetical protein WJX79_006153 [Trebouxia sp. C0005]